MASPNTPRRRKLAEDEIFVPKNPEANGSEAIHKTDPNNNNNNNNNSSPNQRVPLSARRKKNQVQSAIEKIEEESSKSGKTETDNVLSLPVCYSVIVFINIIINIESFHSILLYLPPFDARPTSEAKSAQMLFLENQTLPHYCS